MVTSRLVGPALQLAVQQIQVRLVLEQTLTWRCAVMGLSPT